LFWQPYLRQSAEQTAVALQSHDKPSRRLRFAIDRRQKNVPVSAGQNQVSTFAHDRARALIRLR